MIVESKKLIRKHILEERRNISKQEKEEKDRKILKEILSSKEYKEAKKIFVYVSLKDEVDTIELIRAALGDNKEVFVPYVISKDEGMIAVKIKSLEDLESGSYGILEPKDISNTIEDKNQLDLIIAPAVAMTKTGYRIGYGGGFYDRFLQDIGENTVAIVIVYKEQLIDNIPVEPHDYIFTNVIYA